MGSDLPKVTHRPGGSTSPHPTPPPSGLFPEKRKLVVRGFRGDKLYGQWLCLSQGWVLGRDANVRDRAGKAPRQTQFLGQEAEPPFHPISLYS